MRLIKIFSLSLILIAISFGVSAQNTMFFEAGEDFNKSVESYMGVKTTLNKELKETVKSFTDKVETKAITEEYIMYITVLMNKYASKRANPTPYMLNMIKCINAFWDHNKVDQFSEWNDYMLELIGRNIAISRMNEVVVFTTNLLSTNSLEASSSRNWYLTSSNYEIIMDKDEDGLSFMKVKCDNTDIRCKSRTDSTLVIYGTSGVYNSKTHEWVGKNGKVDWRRGNLSPDSIWADLADYVIDTRSAQFSAENVMFQNVKYFPHPIKGRYEDKVVMNGTGEKARYPQFESYENSVTIPNLAEGIVYEGGYAQHGVLFQGTAEDSASYAKLIFKRGDKDFIIAQSKAFVFGLKRLEGQDVRVNILLDGNLGITHPGLKLKYNSETEQLILFKGSSGMENASYLDNYHNLSINVNQIEWHRNDTVMLMTTRPAAVTNYATFESSDFYTAQRYKELQGYEQIHPLIMMRDFIYAYQSLSFSCADVKRYLTSQLELKWNDVQVHQMLIKLSYDGFITYDVNTRTGSASQKLWDWIGDHANRRDYDCITIQSIMEDKNGVNAELNLNNNHLSIYNVKPFDISISRMVKALPDSAITVSKDREIMFGGKIQAGLVDFYGRNFDFNYEDFNIKIDKADSMAVLTENKISETGRTRIDSVRSVLENITGVLQLDASNNKSGVEENKQYPSLTTTDTSYVYYDKLTSDKYDRETYHMTVFPFKLDSMNFIVQNGVKAKGSFQSGIFPDLDVTLTVQPDLSLGFVLPTPDGGMDLFNGKGSYHNTITLNASGLAGDGEIHYLTAVSRGRQFEFYPDSVSGLCYYVDIKPVKKSEIGIVKDVKAEYPSVHSDSAMVVWSPTKDIFSTSTKDTLLKLYGSTVDFNGKIDLTPTKMIAHGEMLYNLSGLFSDKFTLRNSSFDADSAMLCNFDMRHPGDSTGHFYTDRYNAKYDFDKNYAQFVVSNDSASVYFPQHKYKQKTDFFTWTLDKGLFEFGSTLDDYDKNMIANNPDDFEKIRYANSDFKPVMSGVTLTSNKDTMTYNAVSSSYKNDEDIINVHEPGVIKIVDSKIDPTGIMMVNPGGDISKFENAMITSNLDSMIHKIINTSVKIRDKYYFKAIGGQYEYVNENKDISYLNLDSLEIRKIKADTTADAPKKRVSFGIGTVPEDQHFMLSPQYQFSGKYSFMGNTPGIVFNGYTFIKQVCDTSIMPFRFQGNLNPEHIVFPISDRLVDTAKTRLYSGFFFNEDQHKLYSIFMGYKISNRDVGVLEAKKGLTYSVTGNQFQIASTKRLDDATVNENIISLYKNICDIHGEGSINTNINVAPVEVVTKGSIYHQRDINKITMNSVMTVNLPIRQDFVKMMASELETVDGSKPLYLNKNSVRKKLEMLCGHDTIESIMEDYTLTGQITKMPTPMQKTFVFGDISMNYDTTTHSYRSTGKIGVANIGDLQYNRYVTGYVEIISNKKKGDQITVYLQPDKTIWYYFNYSAGFLYCLSSNQDFNDKIISLKDKDRVIKMKDSEFQYIIGNEAVKNKFMRSFSSVQSNDDEDAIKHKEDINKQIEEENKTDNQPVPTENTDDNSETPADNPEPSPSDVTPDTQPEPQPEENPQPEQEESDFEEESDYEEDSVEQPQPQPDNSNTDTNTDTNSDDEEQDFIDE